MVTQHDAAGARAESELLDREGRRHCGVWVCVGGVTGEVVDRSVCEGQQIAG